MSKHQKQVVEVKAETTAQAIEAVRGIGRAEGEKVKFGSAVVSFLMTSKKPLHEFKAEFKAQGAKDGTWPSKDGEPVGDRAAVSDFDRSEFPDGFAWNTGRQYFQSCVVFNDDGTVKTKAGKCYDSGNGNRGAAKAMIKAGIMRPAPQSAKAEEPDSDKGETASEEAESAGNTEQPVQLNRKTGELLYDLLQGREDLQEAVIEIFKVLEMPIKVK